MMPAWCIKYPSIHTHLNSYYLFKDIVVNYVLVYVWASFIVKWQFVSTSSWCSLHIISIIYSQSEANDRFLCPQLVSWLLHMNHHGLGCSLTGVLEVPPHRRANSSLLPSHNGRLWAAPSSRESLVLWEGAWGCPDGHRSLGLTELVSKAAFVRATSLLCPVSLQHSFLPLPDANWKTAMDLWASGGNLTPFLLLHWILMAKETLWQHQGLDIAQAPHTSLIWVPLPQGRQPYGAGAASGTAQQLRQGFLGKGLPGCCCQRCLALRPSL